MLQVLGLFCPVDPILFIQLYKCLPLFDNRVLVPSKEELL